MNNGQVELSVLDRIILANQYRILESVCEEPDEAKSYRDNRIVVENGYELHYDSLKSTILESRMSRSQCLEVMDILDMYAALKASHGRLDQGEDVDENEIRFRGFDGNHEAEFAEYAEFLIHDLNRWPELVEDREIRTLRGEVRALPMYRRMLSVWYKLSRKLKLTSDEMKQIIGAKRGEGIEGE